MEKENKKQSPVKMTANGMNYESKNHSIHITEDGKIKAEPKLPQN